MTRPVLILGGTGEARALASLLVADGVSVVSSLAGRVRNPRLPDGEVRIGASAALRGWWRGCGRISRTPSSTPPTRSHSRSRATRSRPVRRSACRWCDWCDPRGEAQAGDDWTIVEDIVGAARAVAGGNAARVLLTTGRQDADAFAGIDSAWFLIRVVDPPTGPLPPHHRIVRSRGPYGLDDERTLMADEKIGFVGHQEQRWRADQGEADRGPGTRHSRGDGGAPGGAVWQRRHER